MGAWAVIAYGTVLVDDGDRIGPVAVWGLDETAFVRLGPFRHRVWSTQPTTMTMTPTQ